MRNYLDLLQHILDNGADKTDRTGTGTRSIFGYQLRYDLSKGFPLLTTKKLHLKSIIYELLWFLNGDTNIKYLKNNGVKIWNEWADENGNLGPVYGAQWRSWEGADNKVIDQISDVINQIQNTPDSRRLIVSAWNVAEIPKMALAPCHAMFQFNTRLISLEKRKEIYKDLHKNKNTKKIVGLSEMDHNYFDKVGIKKYYLDLQLYQRSADVFLGVPFNIASYALLTMMVAQVCNMEVGDYVHTFGDVHIYNNHFDQVELQLSREPKTLPIMKINPNVKDIFSFKYEDFTLVKYDPYPGIKAPIAI